LKIKYIIQYFLSLFGIRLIKTRNYDALTLHTMDAVLRRCRDRGLEISTVLDVGASNGRWSEICLRHYPDCYYYLVEAQNTHEVELNLFKKNHVKSDFLLSAAGNKVGEIFFDTTDPEGGVASELPFDKNCVRVPVTMMDEEVKRKGLKPPFLLKLDTHGFEIPILEGARQMLEQTNLVVMEAYNFKLTKDSLRFYEMCSYMEKKGFLPLDFADPMLRKYDQSLWQIDLFFVPSNREEFLYDAFE
jgi:FkbM family methyltransferase